MEDIRGLSEEASPEHMIEAIAANTTTSDTMPQGHHDADPSQTVSVRVAEHRGRHITIRAVYEIEVDGRPFTPHLVVDNAGRVHYHGLPTRDFASLVDLVKRAIDNFPEDFPEDAIPPTEHDHEAGSPTHSPDHAPGAHPGSEQAGDGQP